MERQPLVRLTADDFRRVRLDMLRDLTGFERADGSSEAATSVAEEHAREGAVWKVLLGALAVRR
jgi:hypothetical protein